MTQGGAKSAEDIVGLEYDWLGTDADGHVGLFSTAGGGYAPTAFLLDTDAHDAAIDAILASPTSTVAQFSPELPSGVKNTWRLVAERGIFAFDSDPNGGPYRLVAAPTTPIRCSALPELAAAVASRFRLHRTNFAVLSVISAQLLQQCE